MLTKLTDIEFKNLNFLERGEYIYKFRNEYHTTYEELEKIFKSSKACLNRFVCIHVKATENIKQLCKNQTIGGMVAYYVSRLKPSEQNTLAEKLGGCKSFKEAEALYKVYLEGKGTSQKVRAKESHLDIESGAKRLINKLIVANLEEPLNDEIIELLNKLIPLIKSTIAESAISNLIPI